MWIRVKDTSTGHEFSIDEAALVDGLTVLDKDAVDVRGEPLPAKPKTTVNKAAGKSGSDADTKEK